MASESSVKAILESRPPASDYLTYLTIVESHLSPAILPTLNEILQDVELTQNIGWDLIHLLLPLPGAQDCLSTIARLGNPREVVLKVTEALQLLEWEEEEDTDEQEVPQEDVPTTAERYCELVKLLSILLPRIKTRYPSRFLSTALIALLASFRPLPDTTLAVIAFVHTVSGKKRPPLPGRKSSGNVLQETSVKTNETVPDPEAQATVDPKESAIQQKLLQSFVTHVLEESVNANSLEWSARLQEHYNPGRIVANKEIGKLSIGDQYKQKPELQGRDNVAGQLVALARDLGLSDNDLLVEAIYKANEPADGGAPEEEHPSSPEEIPLSSSGCVLLFASYIFSSVYFNSNIPQPNMVIFPDHAKLVQHFLGVTSSPAQDVNGDGVVDAVIMIGVWLEENNKFVGGPLDDEDFLQLLQTLSLHSANNPSASLRNATHLLTTSILHAHPTDQVRLAFITDTLEHCPFEPLKGSSVSWLREEIITAEERKAENVFSSTVALSATKPYLFPDTSSLAEASNAELVEELSEAYPFHIAVVNFISFLAGNKYSHVVPSSMFTVVEEIYLLPLQTGVKKAVGLSFTDDRKKIDGQEVELSLLAYRMEVALDLLKDK